MRAFFAIVAGFVVTLGMFGGGLVFATYLIAVEPLDAPSRDQNVAELWTPKPQAVNPSEQDFERVPSTALAAAGSGPVDPAPTVSVGDEQEGEVELAMADTGTMSDLTSPSVDVITTGNIDTMAPSEAEEQAPVLPAAHVEWCFSQYRSYRAESDSYTAYSGEQRPCVSPYSRQGTTAGRAVDGRGDAERVAQPLQYVSDARQQTAYLSVAHIQSCLDRYRSYRPEDNTYQPYGGGPRRQCR